MNRLKSISILAIGNELLDGDVIDSNSAYVARGLRGLGLAVERIMITPDDPKRITVALDFLFAESDTIVCSGGLGPTIDDLSRDALADFSGCPLELSEDALMDLAKFYRERKREFSSSRKRQAYIPVSYTHLTLPTISDV